MEKTGQKMEVVESAVTEAAEVAGGYDAAYWSGLIVQVSQQYVQT